MIKLSEIKKIFELINKYNTFNSGYSARSQFPIPGLWEATGGSPQLFDALITGCRLKYSHYRASEVFTPEIENDIKTIVRLNPQSITYNFGCFDLGFNNATPIFAACINDNIPTSIIEFLLESGADPYTTVYACDNNLSIIPILKTQISEERFETIFNLFKKYGFDLKNLSFDSSFSKKYINSLNSLNEM